MDVGTVTRRSRRVVAVLLTARLLVACTDASNVLSPSAPLQIRTDLPPLVWSAHALGPGVSGPLDCEIEGVHGNPLRLDGHPVSVTPRSFPDRVIESFWPALSATSGKLTIHPTRSRTACSDSCSSPMDRHRPCPNPLPATLGACTVQPAPREDGISFSRRSRSRSGKISVGGSKPSGMACSTAPSGLSCNDCRPQAATRSMIWRRLR